VLVYVGRFLGLTVGTVQSNTSIERAQAAYSCHITYVTGQELCFNYLKDNTAQSAAELVSNSSSSSSCRSSSSMLEFV
jgi:preprotein translocase subunit SecA